MKPKPYLPQPSPVTGAGGIVSTPYTLFFNGLIDYISKLTQVGTLAERPPADSVYPGTLYFASDTGLTYISDGSTWVPFSAAGGITQLTGDVTAGPGSGSQVATIVANAVTYAKMQAVAAASRLLGRGTAGGSAVREISLGAGLAMTLDVLAATGSSVILTADPGSPANDTWWLMRDGGSPQNVNLKGRIAGTTYTLFSFTLP